MSDTIFDIAEQLVRRYGTRNPFELAECLGIEIMYSHSLNRLKGMYMYILRNPFIVINSNIPEEQQRIICAHELGHDRLHRALAVQGAIQESSLFDVSTRPEFEANLFAAELLISDDDVVSQNEAGIDAFQLASRLENDANLVLLKLAQMKRRGFPFDVDTSLYDRKFIT